MTADLYKEFTLSSAVDSYLYEKLKYPRTMSQLLKRRKDIPKAKKVTFLPCSLENATMMNFYCSYEIDAGPPEEWILFKITEFLKKQKNNIVLFQNPCACPDDPWIHNDNFQKYMHAFKNEAYFSILPQYVEDQELIRKILIFGGGPYDLLCTMTSLPESMNELPSQLSNEILEDLVTNSSCFFVYAFDDESFILSCFK